MHARTANVYITFTTAIRLKVVTLIKATTENSYILQLTDCSYNSQKLVLELHYNQATNEKLLKLGLLVVEVASKL